MIKRQLTYYVPIERMGRTAQIQAMIIKEAININGQCHTVFNNLHTAKEVFSTLVVSLLVDIEKADSVHRAVKKVITVSLAIYSPSTTEVEVTDIPVMTRDFLTQEEF